MLMMLICEILVNTVTIRKHTEMVTDASKEIGLEIKVEKNTYKESQQ
jgi:hypothetical protein